MYKQRVLTSDRGNVWARRVNPELEVGSSGLLLIFSWSSSFVGPPRPGNQRP